jgi:glycosyltransferase involved in cell wall biosynthesis
MKDINNEGIITQSIFKKCIGEHIYCDLYETPPKADIYILNCFKNLKHLKAFKEFKADGKIISLIHSSEPCMPCENSNIVVTITKSWQKRLKEKYNIESVMIYGGLNTYDFKDVKIDYSKKVFGKISRPERGKYHEEWNYLVIKLLNENIDYKCRIISNNFYKLPIVYHERMKYIENVKINDIEGKKRELSNITIYADAHAEINPFIDTFNMSMLESMACGHAIIILGKYQEPMCEILGDAGIICNTIEEFENKLRILLNDENMKKELGEKAKKRAKFFNESKMVYEWNKLLEGLC